MTTQVRLDDGSVAQGIVVVKNDGTNAFADGAAGGAVTIADGADVTKGERADAAATTDTGAFSLIALIKRGLQNWSTLLTRVPALASGRLPVQTDERPSASAAAITPSDTIALPGGTTRGVYVGGAGNVVALIGGAAVTFTAVPAGSILPVAATRVNATGTTATALVALF